MKNKDPNYLIKVEKAIAEKYGLEAIQNPKANWDPKKEKEYLEQLKKAAKKENKIKDKTAIVREDGFLINKKLINKKSNRQCPTCVSYSFNNLDGAYITKWDCCFKCFLKWVEGREERWKEGWRPDNSEIEKREK